EGKADLAYEIAVDVMPEFEPVDPASLSLKRPVYEPAAKEVDEALAELAKQNRTYEEKTGKAVKAADGDMVVIDFVGKIDGVAFEGGSATDAELVLGSGQFIPGFEEQLVGAKPGAEVEVKVTFPETYQAENLKGKEAEFNAIWQQVQQDKEAGALPPEDAKKSEKKLQEEYRKIAERRVRLGLVLAEIGRANNVQVTDQELNEAMRAEAMRYGPQAQQV